MEHQSIYQTVSQILGLVGFIFWFINLCFYVFTSIHRKWLVKRIDSRWILKLERESELPITEWLSRMTKSIQSMRKTMVLLLSIFTILFSLNFLISFFLRESCDYIVFKGLIITTIIIPMWAFLMLLNRLINDKRKRIIEVVKETHPEWSMG